MKRLLSLSNIPASDSALIKRLINPQSTEILGRLARMAAAVCETPLSFIYLTHGNEWILLASHGLTISRAVEWDGNDYDYIDMGPAVFEIEDAQENDILQDAGFVRYGPKFRYCIGAPLCVDRRMGKGNYVGVVCADFEPRPTSIERQSKLQQISQMGTDIIDMMMTLYTENRMLDSIVNSPKEQSSNGKLAFLNSAPPSQVQSDPLAVEHFLLETLIQQPRMLRRGQRRYFGVRTWRKPIKRFQIEALKALKLRGSGPFVDSIALELAGIVRDIYGEVEKAIIVPVPCGHSGPDCLVCRVSRRMADIMHIDFIEAFAPIEVKGGSHPKTNMRRPKMQLLALIDRPVILVDDVATSGSHIEEAANALAKTAPNVWPIVWIAD